MKKSELQITTYINVFSLLLLLIPIGVNAQKSKKEFADYRLRRTVNGNISTKSAKALQTIIQLDKSIYTLGKAINSIALQADLKPSYSKEYVPVDKKVKVPKSRMTAKKALLTILKGTSLYFKVMPGDQLVFLRKPTSAKKALLTTISGTVTDAKTDRRLAGVNIVVGGTTNGTFTEADGNYELEIESLQDTLIFSFVGYKTKQVPIRGRTYINVKLRKSESSLQETIVLGYEKTKKLSNIKSVSTVTSERLMESPAINLANSLAGKTTGLTVTQFSGLPGGYDPDLFIRGVHSLTYAGSQPLVLVDGVKQSIYDALQLDPNNVESVNILKDAAATAMYGIEGANGVIVINTKRGSEGPPEITAKFTAGFQKPTLLPDFVGSYRYAKLYNQAQLGDGVDPSNLRFTPEAIQAFKTGSHPLLYPNTDWVHYLTKSAAFRTRDNLSFTGGTDNLKYYISGTYLKQNGLFKTFNQSYNFNPSYKKYNIRANIDADITPTTRLSLTSKGLIAKRVRRRVPSSYTGGGGWREIYRGAPFAGAGVVDGKVVTKSPSRKYIPGGRLDPFYAYFNNGYNTYTRNVLNIGLQARQKLNFLTKGLYAQFKGFYYSTFQENRYRDAEYAYYVPYFKTDVDASVNPGDSGDSTTVFRKHGTDGPLAGSASHSKTRHWNVEARLHYKRGFGPHNVEALLIGDQRRTYYPSPYPGIPLSQVGLKGQIKYNYKERYFLLSNAAYNGSENFASGRRFGFFPSVGVGWIVTNEPFMENVDFLNYLKFKASYGIVGSDAGVGRFLYQPAQYPTGVRSSSVPGYSFGNQVPQSAKFAYEGDLGNPRVHWATGHKQNYGINMHFLEDRLQMDFTYFREHRTDILTTLNTVPAFVSAGLPAVNFGVVDNHGYEAKLKWQHDVTSDFSYHIQGNVSFSRSKIVDIDEVHRNYPYQRRTGKPVGTYFGYVSKGFISKDDLKPNSGLPQYPYEVSAGNLKFKDLNGDGVINDDDQRAIGYPRKAPEYTFGATIGFHFKNFDVQTVWYGAAHISRNLAFAPYRTGFGPGGQGWWSLLKWQADGAWTEEKAKEGKKITYPRLTTTVGQRRNQTATDFWIKNASYLRLKNVVIGYSLSPKILNNIGVKRMRIYFKGYDLLTFSPIKKYGIDPGSDNGSSTGIRYPVNKVFNFGVNIHF